MQVWGSPVNMICGDVGLDRVDLIELSIVITTFSKNGDCLRTSPKLRRA